MGKVRECLLTPDKSIGKIVDELVDEIIGESKAIIRECQGMSGNVRECQGMSGDDIATRGS